MSWLDCSLNGTPFFFSSMERRLVWKKGRYTILNLGRTQRKEEGLTRSDNCGTTFHVLYDPKSYSKEGDHSNVE